MPIVANNARVLRDAVVQIGDNNFETSISNVTLTPTATSVTWSGVGGNTLTDSGTATWVAALTFAQDHDTPNSLSEFLFDNEGATFTFYFRPKNGTGSGYSAVITITPGAIGGAVNTFNESTVTLGMNGKPTRIPGTPTVPVLAAAAPTTGAVAGGTLVKVTGSKFTGTTAVKFGTVNATSFTVVSDGLIVAVAPAQAAGAKAITVTNAVGVSATTPYTYA
jgi:hypothetical protein